MSYKKYLKEMILILVLMFAFSLSINVCAEEPVDNNDYSNEVVPGYEKTSRWSYTSSVHAALTLDTSGNATGNCDVTGYQSLTTKIIVYTYLQRVDGNEWVNVSSASHTANSWHAAYQDSFGTQSWGHDHGDMIIEPVTASMCTRGILMRTLYFTAMFIIIILWAIHRTA